MIANSVTANPEKHRCSRIELSLQQHPTFDSLSSQNMEPMAGIVPKSSAFELGRSLIGNNTFFARAPDKKLHYNE